METLWLSSFLQHLIRKMLTSALASTSAGILCHLVEGTDRWQTSLKKCKSVMSNFRGSGSPEEGNNFSHCSSNINRFLLNPSSFGRLLSSVFCYVDPGCMESKNFPELLFLHQQTVLPALYHSSFLQIHPLLRVQKDSQTLLRMLYWLTWLTIEAFLYWNFHLRRLIDLCCIQTTRSRNY